MASSLMLFHPQTSSYILSQLFVTHLGVALLLYKRILIKVIWWCINFYLLWRCLPTMCNIWQLMNYFLFRWVIPCYVKKVHWDCSWEVEDDSNLLRGIFEYGMGSWESMKMDNDMGLCDKILPVLESSKPQAKHLQTRAEYLLKMLRKQQDFAASNAVSRKIYQRNWIDLI